MKREKERRLSIDQFQSPIQAKDETFYNYKNASKSVYSTPRANPYAAFSVSCHKSQMPPLPTIAKVVDGKLELKHYKLN